MNRFLHLGLLVVAQVAPWAALGQVNNPADPQRQAAIALEQAGNNAQAETAWRTYSKAHPSNPEPYAHLAILEARQEHYKEAIPLYRKAIALNPRVQGLRLNLGLALFKSGDLKAAIPEFTQALKTVTPDSPDAQRLTILIGMAHYGVAQYAEAVPYLKQATAGDTQNLQLRLALAHSCLWSKQLPCVMDTYHEILSLNSESAEADMIAGEALDEMKDNEGSTKMFRAAVAANPREPNVHFGLGYLLWTQKIYPEAAQEFQAELANDPQHLQSMAYLADTYVQLNNTSDARPLLEKVIRLEPNLAMAHLDLGIINADADRNEDALREFQTAARLDPNDVNVHWRLGRLYRTLGKKDLAKIELDKANSLNRTADTDLFNKIAKGKANPPANGANSADQAKP